MLSRALAVDGGIPVRSTMLAYGRQHVDDRDIERVTAVLRSDWLTTGPMVVAFERAVAAVSGAAHAVAVNSGTAALHAAVAAAGIGPGDEVIVPPMTFAASANCALYRGARPVFCDVLAGSLNVDPASAAAAVTPQSRAIVAVDYAGQPCDHAEIRALADRHGLTVIEDASHSLGASYRGRRVGELHELTTLSFHPVKHITTGEGGMILTGDAALAERLRAFRTHGITADFRQRMDAGSWVYDMVELGFNYRLPDVNCALGLSQLERLSEWLARRDAIVTRYRAAFAESPAIELLEVAGDRTAAWHLFVIKLRLDRLRAGRPEVFKALRAENIGVNVHYRPVYWHSYYERLGYRRGICPVAEAEYERILTLPLFPAMTDSDVEDVITACQKVLTAYLQ
jgi:UDP-4-amino-4,6-dideoxy-N-acetyl-beta-L-altrosamine transaminase